MLISKTNICLFNNKVVGIILFMNCQNNYKMQTPQQNKKFGEKLNSLINRSFPKKKMKFPQTMFKIKQPFPQQKHLNFCIDQQTINLKPSTTSYFQGISKPSVITIKFDDENEVTKRRKNKNHRRLLTSSMGQDNARKHYFKQMFDEREPQIEDFVKKSLRIGAYQVKKIDNDYQNVSRRLLQFNYSKKLSKNQETISRTCAEIKSVKKPIDSVRTTRKLVMTVDTNRSERTQTLDIPMTETNKRTIKFALLTNKTFFQNNKTDLIPVRKPTVRKDYFIFGMSDNKSNSPENRLENYRDFLWKINFSNDLFVVTPTQPECTYKAYIGGGNNCFMVKGILRRRYWWTIVDKPSNANLVWTQLKINSYFTEQPSFTQNSQKTATQELDFDFEIEEQPDQHKFIFRDRDYFLWKEHLSKNSKTEEKYTQQTYIKRLWLFATKQIKKIENSANNRMHNHLQNNFYLGNKKALFYNVRRYCEFAQQNVFNILPMTFHISKGIDDSEYLQFTKYFSILEQHKKTDKSFKNVWIVKPGQNTNRGNGISVCYSLDDIKHRLRGKQKNSDGKLRTFIIQKYIEKPLLFNKRKFDIRHYLLVTCINQDFKAYWYQQGYIRTSSSYYCLKPGTDILTHLTNDAVQKNAQGYGKFEKGNKISYIDFEKYLKSNYRKKNISFYRDILPKMRQQALIAVKSTYLILDPLRRQSNFQLFGLDYMIDEDFNPWLIQFNTNPCLQLSCPLLQRLIPTMIENAFRICIDPIYPPPQSWAFNKKQFFGQNPLVDNRFELFFDQKTSGKTIQTLFEGKTTIDDNMGKIQEDNEIFEDCGNQDWESTRNQ